MYNCNSCLILIVIFCFFANNSLAGQCQKHEAVTTVSNSIKPVKYLQKLYSNDLAEFHTGGVNDDSVLGLMGGGISNVFTAKFEVMPLEDNTYCLLMKRIDVKFTALPTIHIARNFPRGSCEYTSVLKHELKHVGILKVAYKANIPKYRNYVRRIAFDAPVLPPMRLSEINHQKEYMIGYINYELSEYIQGLLDDISERQMEIDTPESYRLDVGGCDLWKSKL